MKKRMKFCLLVLLCLGYISFTKINFCLNGYSVDILNYKTKIVNEVEEVSPCCNLPEAY